MLVPDFIAQAKLVIQLMLKLLFWNVESVGDNLFKLVNYNFYICLQLYSLRG